MNVFRPILLNSGLRNITHTKKILFYNNTVISPLYIQQKKLSSSNINYNNSGDRFVFNILKLNDDKGKCKLQLYINSDNNKIHAIFKPEYYNTTIFTGKAYIDGNLFSDIINKNVTTDILSDYCLRNNVDLDSVINFSVEAYSSYLSECIKQEIDDQNYYDRLFKFTLFCFVFILAFSK